MLIVSRQRDQKVIVETSPGVTVSVQIIDIRGDKVRVGIEAPKSMRVDREEVYARRAAELAGPPDAGT